MGLVLMVMMFSMEGGEMEMMSEFISMVYRMEEGVILGFQEIPLTRNPYAN